MQRPKVRFKGFTDDWEQRKLFDIYASIGNAFVGTATPYYVESGHFYLESNNIKDGQINHNSEIFINDEFYEKQKDKWLHTGDMVMVQSGHVGHAAVIPEELDNSAAHALIMFRHPKEKIEPYFLNYQYQTNKSKKKIEEITTGNTIKHILASDMQEFVVDITNYDEQKKIGSYFQKLDHLITFHQRKCEQTKKLKKYMLQKMFPKEGQTVPEVRFEGFTDAWEKRKLGEVGTTFTGLSGKTAEDFGHGDANFITYMNVFLNPVANPEMVEHVEIDSKQREVQVGDVFFTTSSEIPEEVGMSCVLKEKHGVTYLNSFCFGFRPNIKFDLDYLAYTLRSEPTRSQIKILAQGISRFNISKNKMMDIIIQVPNLNEQTKIGAYFSNLDHLITLHQRKCDELQNIKKFMLQNMFI